MLKSGQLACFHIIIFERSHVEWTNADCTAGKESHGAAAGPLAVFKEAAAEDILAFQGRPPLTPVARGRPQPQREALPKFREDAGRTVAESGEVAGVAERSQHDIDCGPKGLLTATSAQQVQTAVAEVNLPGGECRDGRQRTLRPQREQAEHLQKTQVHYKRCNCQINLIHRAPQTASAPHQI